MWMSVLHSLHVGGLSDWEEDSQDFYDSCCWETHWWYKYQEKSCSCRVGRTDQIRGSQGSLVQRNWRWLSTNYCVASHPPLAVGHSVIIPAGGFSLYWSFRKRKQEKTIDGRYAKCKEAAFAHYSYIGLAGLRCFRATSNREDASHRVCRPQQFCCWLCWVGGPISTNSEG